MLPSSMRRRSPEVVANQGGTQRVRPPSLSPVRDLWALRVLKGNSSVVFLAAEAWTNIVIDLPVSRRVMPVSSR